MIDTLHLIARIGETWVALPTERISSVVKADQMIAVPAAPPSVLGLMTIRSRIVTCIDAMAIMGEGRGLAPFMAILSIDGHCYGIALDEVDDVISLSGSYSGTPNLPSTWSIFDPRLADSHGQALVVIDPARIVAAASGHFSLAA